MSLADVEMQVALAPARSRELISGAAPAVHVPQNLPDTTLCRFAEFCVQQGWCDVAVVGAIEQCPTSEMQGQIVSSSTPTINARIRW